MMAIEIGVTAPAIQIDHLFILFCLGDSLPLILCANFASLDFLAVLVLRPVDQPWRGGQRLNLLAPAASLDIVYDGFCIDLALAAAFWVARCGFCLVLLLLLGFVYGELLDEPVDCGPESSADDGQDKEVDVVGSDEKSEEDDLKTCKRHVGCENEGRCWARCEDGVHQVNHEGRHFGVRQGI